MVKVDLITGFLGSGKTTFLRMYAKYLMNKGLKIGILENDYGAVNVDMLLLQDLRGDKCELEMVSGGCDADCHKRRFKTKLIAMGMSGYDRVIIEPSGIFDVDEFFDTLREEPLDNWYEIGNVITIVDAELENDMSDLAEFYLASQAASAGCILLSRTRTAGDDKLENTVSHLKQAIEKVKCDRKIDDIIITKDWDKFDDADFERISKCGYKISDYVKNSFGAESQFKSVYLLEMSPDMRDFKEKIKRLFEDNSFGHIFRIKGFFKDENENWYQLNATKNETAISQISVGQDVFIIIGEEINEEKIKSFIC